MAFKGHSKSHVLALFDSTPCTRVISYQLSIVTDNTNDIDSDTLSSISHLRLTRTAE